MEKLLYALWREETAETFAKNLLNDLVAKLIKQGAQKIKVNITNKAVAPAAPLHQNTIDAPDATLSFWLNSAHIRTPFEEEIKKSVHRLAGYVVSESTVLPLPSSATSRTEGFCQIAFLGKPPRLTRTQWLDHWMGHHTKIAVETQSTFYYSQNIIVRPLTPNAPPWDAIVEECFPAEAMTNQQVFFDVADNPEKLEKNIQIMMESCGAFIDFDKIDVIAASQYRIGGWGDLDHDFTENLS